MKGKNPVELLKEKCCVCNKRIATQLFHAKFYCVECKDKQDEKEYHQKYVEAVQRRIKHNPYFQKRK